jgi:hypothetical protein
MHELCAETLRFSLTLPHIENGESLLPASFIAESLLMAESHIRNFEGLPLSLKGC